MAEENQILDSEVIEDKIFNPEHNLASQGKRFGNHIIDIIGYYLTVLIIGFMLGLIAPELVTGQDEDSPFFTILALVVLFLYYFIFEGILGKTPGKFITKTKVVTIDGRKPDFQETFIRTICRLIPFDAFSFLGGNGYGWHDSLSKTRVVNS